MISSIHIREINEQNWLDWHEWCTVASPYTIYSNRPGSYRTPLMPPQPILLIYFSNMYKQYHAILMGVVKQKIVFY